LARHRGVVWFSALWLAVLPTACGDDDNPSGGEDTAPAPASGTVSSAPPPGEMCEEDGETPVLAAYSLDDGEFRWVVCSPDQVRHDVLAASDEAVYLEAAVAQSTELTVVAYDTEDGSELASADPPPDQSIDVHRTADGRSTVEVDGVRVLGGQDDPTTGVAASTGEVLWEKPGSPVYDDVWAVGDGAVYVIDRRSDPASPRLVAYEIESGDARWERKPVDPYGTEMGWPWHVAGDVLFTIWSNLALLDTTDGSTMWRTDYPAAEFPRMTGVRANAETVFVAFSSVRSGGD
jgi:hypothetical protein